MRAADVKAALRARFCAPEWAIFFEVGDGTGTNQRRWADAVAMNMWPSRGLEIHGYEIKVSRSDWLRELKQPEKSATVQQYCDRWWVITPKGIVKEGELPPTWGLYEVSDTGAIRQVVAAPTLSPVPVTRHFMAAVLRRAGGVDQDEVQAAVSREAEKLREQFDKRVARRVEDLTRDAKDAIDRLKEFEQETGLNISAYGAIKEVASSINFLRSTGVLKTWGGLVGLAADAEAFATKVREFTRTNPRPADTDRLL